jgi:hypothetical protein
MIIGVLIMNSMTIYFTSSGYKPETNFYVKDMFRWNAGSVNVTEDVISRYRIEHVITQS